MYKIIQFMINIVYIMHSVSAIFAMSMSKWIKTQFVAQFITIALPS